VTVHRINNDGGLGSSNLGGSGGRFGSSWGRRFRRCGLFLVVGEVAFLLLAGETHYGERQGTVGSRRGGGDSRNAQKEEKDGI